MFSSSIHTANTTENVFRPNSPNSKAYHKQRLLITRQMTILNSLVDLLYTLFRVRSVSVHNLIGTTKETGEQRDRASTVSFMGDKTELFEDGFVNAECKPILDSFGDLVSQSDIHELIDEHKSLVSSGSFRKEKGISEKGSD
jgi:hypothetical protein